MILPPDIETYTEQHTTNIDGLLAELNRETHVKTSMPQMISGPYQGKLLQMLSKMVRPNKVLEIGTFTGFATICLAAGLKPGGQVITLDIDEELQHFAQQYFIKAELDSAITCICGDAKEIIPTLNGPFDMVFIDADKVNYGLYFDLIVEKVRPGGLIIADNVLWNGDVLNEVKDKRTSSLDAFNKKIQEDIRIENILIPVRDGLMLIAKL